MKGKSIQNLAKSITIFYTSMEEQERKVRELEQLGYKVIPEVNRKVDDGVSLELMDEGKFYA